ncbi:hypothetical protein RGU70_11750 [Herbaspirillum sp. RTI4]|uniref:hypothetical protein n=1 Tax=Herbaspirillum sp. RTI4 TaxID=3048640 RepID=UPI002AB523C1|nr:hypothetical protein [Herbaspirillum sp. RTI4]MDY7578996.1 hypothetical protein [Herbaspirillum sp. RTI4]MEA9980927.1 hypothetical protein [Herbaspirillum sp. RTI4]
MVAVQDWSNQAIEEMDGVTQRNAALVEEAAAAAQSMQEEARKLSNAVSIFKLDDVYASALLQPKPLATPAKFTTKTIVPGQRKAISSAVERKVINKANEWEEF